MLEVRDAAGEMAFTFTAFFSIVPVIAALVTGIVVVAGLAATVFLLTTGSLLRALVAAALTGGAAWAIGSLVPHDTTALQHEGKDAVQIRQRSVFPSSAYLVSDATGTEVAMLRRPLGGRIGPERWVVVSGGRVLAEAFEDSRTPFLLRALAGVFTPRRRTALRLETGGIRCAAIRRTGDGLAVEITSSALDPRIALALGAILSGAQR